MTNALVNCATCGDLKVTTADLTVHTWASDGREDVCPQNEPRCADLAD